MNELQKALVENAREEHTRCLDRLAYAGKCGDTEAAHSIADDALCAFLKALGYADVVSAFEDVER